MRPVGEPAVPMGSEPQGSRDEILAELAAARAEVRQLAAEQAALSRVAALAAKAASPEEIFSAVAEQVAQLAHADIALVLRYEPADLATVLGGWGDAGRELAVGSRLTVEGEGVAVSVLRTGQPARTSRFAGPPGSIAGALRQAGLRTGDGTPILVEGRLWGAVIAARASPERLSPAAEGRMPFFIELVATAIAEVQARAERRRYAEEQAGLRRVATLVAGAAPPAAVFTAVAEEVGNVLPAADQAYVGRYDSGRELEFVGGWSRAGVADWVGHRVSLGGQNIATQVFETSEPARLDHRADDDTAVTTVARRAGARSGAGAPIMVEGRLWGVMTVGSACAGGLPTGIERRLAGFTELVATAIATAQARVELRDYADEQAALRRLAMLVARGAPPEEVFEAATAEIGQVAGADFTGMSRYDEDGMATEIGVWARPGITPAIAVGDRLSLGGRNLTTRVFQTSQPARMDDYGGAPGAFADAARASGFRSGVGAPISVRGRLWGVVSVGTGGEAPMPADTEARLAGFTELVATAIANAEAHAELTASRARIVAAADETRRRIELDLHDGAQQRLVSLAVQLRAAQEKVPAESGELAAEIAAVTAGLNSALMELRDYARGIHPAVLATSGLASALKGLARRSLVPVELDLLTSARLPERVEVTAYYVVSEALANAAKHAKASIIRVRVEADDEELRLSITDDGVGGANPAHGSGLVGLKDRVAAIGGRLTVQSRPGEGTSLVSQLPLNLPQVPDLR